jgi:hypothetical protein
VVLCLDIFAQMAVASVAHLYIFPATPYHELEGGKDRSVKVLADYAAFDSPLDPEEIRESERPSMVKFFGVDVEKGATSVKESVHDVLVVGGNHVSLFLNLIHLPSYISFLCYHSL